MRRRCWADAPRRIHDPRCQLNKFVRRFPVVNFMYFAFFDDSSGVPTRADLSVVAQGIALVSALLFTIIAV